MSNHAAKPSSSTFLGLPEEIRLILFGKYVCDPKDNLNLRQVCSLLKYEIDHHIGIRSQVTLTNSIENPTIQTFLKNVALRNVHMNGSLCPPKILLQFGNIVHQPLKLEELRITGGFWYQFMTDTILQKCAYIRKLELNCFLFHGTLENSLYQNHPANLIWDSTASINLPLLDDLTLISEPYPTNSDDPECINTYKMYCKIPFHFVQSINAPRLTKLSMKIKYICSVQLDILNIFEHTVMLVLAKCSYLKSIRIFIEKSDRGFTLSSYRLPAPQLQLVNYIQDMQEDFEEIRLQTCNNLSKLEEFKLHLDSDKGHEKILHRISNYSNNLQDFGIKIRNSLHFNSQLGPLIQANADSLRSVFIFCGFLPVFPEVGGGDDVTFRNWIDFSIFSMCPNLEVISLHEDVKQNRSRTGRTLLKNVAFGVTHLYKLKTLILDGLVLDTTDLEEMSTFLRITASSTGENCLEIIGITQASVGASILRNTLRQNEPVLTGVTFRCFMNFLNNRKLNALLLDMDSVLIMDFKEGFAIEKTREAITGQFRSLMLDLSNQKSGSKSFPYWKTSFLGFTVDFPIL